MLSNLTTAMLAALLGAIVALGLRQSVVVGYLLAGLAIGPFTPGFIGDVVAVESLAEIGIVFLMFVIGAQLSFRELLRAGRVALVGATVQVSLTIGAGVLIGRLLGMGLLEALFFGAVVSNSSSTVLGKVFAERDLADVPAARTALAWSSVQDLGTVILVAALSALSSAERDRAHLAENLGRTAVFVFVVLPIAVLALPRVLERIARLRNREVFVLASGCVALGISYVAGRLGVSTALGAFLAGAIVGDSNLSHRILGETIPLRDLFSGLFFVSIGMLIDPRFVLTHPVEVLVGAATIVVLKGVLTTLVARWLGGAWGPAAMVGAGLAQSGEFSLLMARLGAGLGALSGEVFHTLLSSTALSILVAPHLAAASLPIGRWLARFDAQPGLETTPRAPALEGHVVVCGHGRVGSIVVDLLRRRGVEHLVIDEDLHVVLELRGAGVPAILGDASRAVVLERAGVERAAAVVVAVPDKLAAPQILHHVKSVGGRAKVLARTHSSGDAERLEALGVHEAVVGETELALELGRRALEASGLPARAVEVAVDAERKAVPGEAESGPPSIEGSFDPPALRDG
jgi:CPA2 family monovalent cation:H+ antiporter-2